MAVELAQITTSLTADVSAWVTGYRQAEQSVAAFDETMARSQQILDATTSAQERFGASVQIARDRLISQVESTLSAAQSIAQLESNFLKIGLTVEDATQKVAASQAEFTAYTEAMTDLQLQFVQGQISMEAFADQLEDLQGGLSEEAQSAQQLIPLLDALKERRDKLTNEMAKQATATERLVNETERPWRCPRTPIKSSTLLALQHK